MSILIPLLVLLASPFDGGQKPDSLITMARERGGTAGFTLHLNTPISTIEGMVDDSTLIIQGIVRSVSTKLSPDESVVRTAYEVVPVRYYKGLPAVRKQPGAPQPLVVIRPGGTLDVDGLHLSTTVDIFPENESLAVGDVAILFLEPSYDTGGEFRLTGGPFGAFKLNNGTVAPLTTAVALRRGDGTPTVGDFERRILSATAK